MDILEQCQKWHENDEYRKIIDALEAVPASERTPEMDSELARAYNNLADPIEPEGRDMLKKAIALLAPHEEYFAGDHCWNFRMGYAYYYLDQEGRALPYFRRALEARPGDEDTEQFLKWCKEGIALPRFLACFRERTEDWWETFAEMEAELRQMMDAGKDHTRGAELVAQMQETLNLVFDEISFEMGFNGEKHELILTPEGDKVKLFELVYFRKHAPKEVLKHWNILVGRQPNPGIALRTDDGCEISGDDVQVWIEQRSENSFALSAYCEKLPPRQSESDGRPEWLLYTLTDQVLGEISHMRYIDDFNILDAPKKEPSITLSQLPERLRQLGAELSADPEAYLEAYTGYKMEPNEDPDADWRLDVIAGSTCCVPLINGYLSADNCYVDELHADGAVAGFFCYPLDTLREEKGSDKIFDFRDKLEAALTGGDGPEILTLTGGATGLYCGYVDFIAWDIRAALQMAKKFFEDSDIPWASFHNFRREAGTVPLKEQEDGAVSETEAENDSEQLCEPDEPLMGADYIPYTPENAEAFFQQLEKWIDEDEHTRCIRALDAIPEDLRNYRTAYALARALENYAIIGDHDEGTPNSKGDKALLRAIEVLESVREEGQDKAEWNMRMAYAYQYLYGQEEKAIPFAKRWAELDPTDKNAPQVIRECEEEIAKRAEAEVEKESDHTEEFSNPEVYTWEEMDTVQAHIGKYFGEFENIYHEIVSPDIHVDICVIPPSEERDYYTLVTMGMGAHRMNVPEELAEYKLERAELAIALPSDWKLDQQSWQDERWYWPIRLLKDLARMPIYSDSWLGGGHTVANDEPESFADNTELCASILIDPQNIEEDGAVCALPNGEEVNFYQVIPLYREELEYKLAHDADALLDKMNGISFVVEPDRPNAITRGTLCSGDDEDSYVVEMDDADWHLETIQEKNLPVDEINAYNHMAIYLRWCMEHELMGEEFLTEHGDVVEKVKTAPGNVDLRTFIRDELDGQLVGPMFNKIGRAFASYYYGEADSPYFPSDIDDYALRFFGPARYHSDEFRQEAYLFIPFDEDYYQAMAKVIEERFTNWQGQDFDESTLEPSEVAKAIMEYLDCECTYFPSMKDDDPIMSAYSYARRLGVREGYIPVLIKPDETLLECLVMNADPAHDADFYEFDLKTVTEYRKKMLSAPIKDGKAVLEELTGQRKEEAEDDDMDWETEIIGKMENGYNNYRFSGYWNDEMTYPLILAKIPVKNPWEIFAYLPFGNWNECPDTPELMAIAKYWFEQYGAVPAAMSHDELEFLLPAPVPKERAMELAVEQYGFCPDVIDQGPEDATVGTLADVLRQSTVWYFWWD